MMTGLIILAFVCSSPLLMTSCSKKAVKSWADKAFTRPTSMQKAEAPAEAPAVAPGRTARMQELEKAKRIAEEMRVFETTNIYFDFDKSELKPEAKAVLKKKADWLSDNSGYALRIMGNCDERGTAEYNLALGERRAHAAKQFLTALGISADRIYTVSYGEEKPAVPGHNEAAWSKNRRDEFKLIK
jgi:peptidoglycan-associated lipoprotein